jgi:hypothetical protein
MENEKRRFNFFKIKLKILIKKNHKCDNYDFAIMFLISD